MRKYKVKYNHYKDHIQHKDPEKWERIKEAAFQKYGHVCAQSHRVWCSGETADNVDHIKPIFEGGDEGDVDRLDNIQVLCQKCHWIKQKEEFNCRDWAAAYAAWGEDITKPIGLRTNTYAEDMRL